MRPSTRVTVAIFGMLLLLPAQPAASHSSSAEQNGLHYFFETLRDTYTMHEDVPMEYTVTNITEEPMVVFHPCVGLGGMSFAVWDPVDPFHPESHVIWGCCGCFTSAWWDTLDPGESYSRQVTWDMENWHTEEPITRAGTYTLEGQFSASSGDVSLCCVLVLEIEVLSGSTGLAEPEHSWGNIKALYR